VQSRDLEHLEPGQIAYTLLLNNDGSVFNDATAWRLDADRWWLFTGRRSDTERLRGISLDRSGECAIAALQGPASARILGRLIDPELVRTLRYFRPGGFHTGSAPGVQR
jgi:glycine cleavage system aminomethyltransferase T